MLRFFIPDLIEKDVPLSLNREQSHKLTKVMRLRGGDECLVFNADRGEWRTQVIDAHTLMPRVQVRGGQPLSQRAPTLLFAPIKAARMEWMVQRATEMGCRLIAPVLTEHVQVRSLKDDKLAAYALQATEQCQGLHVPAIEKLRPLPFWLKKLRENNYGLIFCDEEAAGSGAGLHHGPSHEGWAILVGPEGGFSRTERELIKREMAAACYTVALGPLILRADTAAVAALAIYQTHLGDWQAQDE